MNPHLVSPHRQMQAFDPLKSDRVVPGLIFDTGGQPIRAPAAGIVHFVGQRGVPGDRVGGLYVRIAHDLYDGLREPFYPRVTLYRHQAYRTTIYGLETVQVEPWQSVHRGQIIGNGFSSAATNKGGIKLVLEERTNPVNPDDFGTSHSFMRYAVSGEMPETDLDEMHRRIDRQIEILGRLNAYYSGRLQDDIRIKIHSVIDTEKFTDYPVFWSNVEKFRYLTHRFRTTPKAFPGLSTAAYESMTRAFMQNQPILLSLPLTPPK